MSYLCLCGHVIKDNLYPSPNSGDLKWQPEFERASNDSTEALRDFFEAVQSGEKDEWLISFFVNGDFYLTAELSTIVTDIVSRFDNKEGHTVYRCPECLRIYIQDQYSSDNYDCYEKMEGYSRV